ncbi:TlpA family protein disulfide reductase [Candidatus Bathyarchaeota archaeon]|nr:TlpA family protein disulfide reductase [Candidatus Bathyarchaeota archaeon]
MSNQLTETHKIGTSRILLLLAVAVVISSIAGWYLLQPKGRGDLQAFSLTDLNGNTLLSTDLRGKVVVLDFMATWCGPCKTQMSSLKTIWEKYGNNIHMISTDVDPSESVNTIKAYMQQFTYATWKWTRDTANLANTYEVAAIPTIVIMDPNGYTRFTHIGVTDSTTLIREIDSLMT